MPSTFTLTLPLCPSTNNLFFNRKGGGRARSVDYEAWLKEAGWLVNTARLTPIRGAVAVCIALPIDMPGDIDNRAKGALDLLVKHALIEDDKHVQSLTLQRSLVGDRKGMVITVSGMKGRIAA